MKKKISVLLCLFMLLVGCGPEVPKADKKLVCLLQSENEGQTLDASVEIDYNSKEDEIIKGIFRKKYDNLVKNTETDAILFNLVERESLIQRIQGAEVVLTKTNNSFDFIETWNYNEIDFQNSLSVDEIQSHFIEDGKYSIKKIKEYYQMQGYTCKEKDIK